MLKRELRQRYLNRRTIPLVIYIFYVGSLTLAPFDFSVAAFAARAPDLRFSLSLDFVLNTFGFVPLGAILYFLTQSHAKGMRCRWGITTAIAAIVSLSLEAGQLFLPTRDPSLLDVVANAVGGGLGFWATHHLRQSPWIIHLRRYGQRLALYTLMLYVAGLIGLFLLIPTSQKLEGWDPGYPLLIGNEATLDRPWLGKIFFVALYDRVLTADQIEVAFQGGPNPEAELHLRGEPIVLYPFQERGGTHVYDRSLIGVPLDLEIAAPQQATWLPDGGLELTGPTVLRSSRKPEKIYHRFTATDSFSVVAWIEPKDSLQVGPARILSFSLNPYLRNFTLGQEKSEIRFRVRSALAGPNGTRLELRTKGLGLGRKPTHVAVTYDRGTEQFYVNGVLLESLPAHNGLTFMAWVLKFNAASGWQIGLLAILLIGPVGGGCWLVLTPSP